MCDLCNILVNARTEDFRRACVVTSSQLLFVIIWAVWTFLFCVCSSKTNVLNHLDSKSQFSSWWFSPLINSPHFWLWHFIAVKFGYSILSLFFFFFFAITTFGRLSGNWQPPSLPATPPTPTPWLQFKDSRYNANGRHLKVVCQKSFKNVSTLWQ